MTPKYYNQAIEKESLSKYKEVYSHHNLIRRSSKEPSDRAGSRFYTVGLIETHVLELKSPILEKADDFLDVSFQEWQKWLNDIELRHSQIRYKYRSIFTPTDFAKITTPDNSYA